MRSEKATLGRERHVQKRVVSIWESPKSARLDKALSTFSTLTFMMSTQKVGGQTGHPRSREAPNMRARGAPGIIRE